jgi:proteasome lid subunit RPN8/RPN11
MPHLHDGIRGANVNSWTEVEPDAVALPLTAFVNRQSFVDSVLALQMLQAGSSVWMHGECMQRILRHLNTRRSELGGLLLGRAYVPRELAGAVGGALTIVENALESSDFRSTSVSLAMGTELWNRARCLVGAGTLVVGWYHSHPNLGAFFSGTDRSTQRSFFYHPYSVGLVVDPCRNDTAWFSGRASSEIPQSLVLTLR